MLSLPRLERIGGCGSLRGIGCRGLTRWGLGFRRICGMRLAVGCRGGS